MELECLTPEFPQGARIYSVDGVAPSLLNSASAMRSQGFLVCGGGDSMKICESKPVICRASGQASADTLDNTCPCLTCDHEAPIVAGSYCLAGNMIDRNTGMNGTGVDENVTFTLNTVDRHAVAYDARHHCLNGNVSGTLQAKGEGGWSLNYINPVIQPLPEATGADTYNGTVTGEVAATLTKVNGVATSGPKVIQAGEKGSPDWIVRRLIPLECGRLQGFPDGWAEIAPLTSPQEFPFWREVYARDCEIKGKRPSRKIVQGGSTESDKALMRWHDGLHSMAAEYAMWGNGMALPNALFFVKNAFRELGKPAEDVKLGSLFDGSGTMPLCAVMCGGRAVWASEVEPYPIAVTRTHLPHMKHLGSVKDVRGDKIEPVDIITFGSPCQDLSIAGKRAGLGGGRSGLFWEAIRIIIEMLVATNSKYPRFVIWENVPGALSSNGGKDFETVLNNDMIARRYFCQLAYTNFGESDWAVTFTYDHGHQPAPGDFDQVDRDWTNFTRRLKRFCKKMGREASKWMQVAEYSVVDEDGKVTGRHHHHAILQGNLTWQEIKDLWRDSTGRPMGLVKVEPIDLTCSSFERLTTYMTKARARIRRWRQSQGLKKPKTPRPNDTRWSRKRFDEAFTLPDDRAYWEKKYPGYTLRECEQHITGNNTKHLIVKLKKKPDTRRKNRRNQP